MDCGFILGLESKKNGTAAFTEERARLFLEVVAEFLYHELFTVALYTDIRRSELLGLPSLRFHDLRHTHTSLMLKQGIHLKVMSERWDTLASALLSTPVLM